ncbi:MAG: hypothetical protein LBG10_07945 [Treponema sp.]|jgi:hypothetical protein|nr:hypothetical protein [Treponema sp.]
MLNGPETKRRLIIRAALVAVWICLGVIIFIMNRGHTLLVDNHSIEAENLRAPDLIKVLVDHGKPIEFFRGDRDIFEVGGGGHVIRVEFSDGTPPLEKRFSLPLGPDMFLLSVPRMIRGDENYIEVFYTQPESRSEGEAETAGAEGEEPAELF